MPDMGRGIIAPANNDSIGTGASEMRALASTAAAALDALEASLMWTTGWVSVTPDTGTTGTVKVKRSASGGGDRTTLRLEGVLPPAGAGSAFLATLPAGFRHTGEHYFIADGRGTETASQIGLYNGSRVAYMHQANGGTGRPTDPISGEYTWESPDSRPTI